MKWIAIGVGVLAVLFGAYAVNMLAFTNPRVAAELSDSPDGERARKVTLLTLPSGKAIPVNYLREGDVVYVGADGPWWREIRGQRAPVSLLILGETLSGHATAIEDDPERTRDVFARLRPAAPSWLPDWLNGVLIVIDLES